jgi:general nucleoside transport system permease protein
VSRAPLWAIRAAPAAISLASAFLLAIGFAVALGVAPGEMLSLVATRFGAYAWGQVLYKATFLIFTGLAVALAFAGGLFNIGAEGQAVVGSLACALVGIAGAALPGVLLLPAAIAGAFLGGGLWGLIPGWLKARWGTHEVINTIMLNFIALALSNFLIARYLGLPETVRTAEIGAGAFLPRLDGLLPGMRGAAVNLSLGVALAAAVAAHLFLYRTRAGLELRAIGNGRRQASVLGIDPGRGTRLAFFLAGGLAGLAGTNFVLGYKHYYEDGFSGGIGFLGIAVALLARNRPLLVVPAALLFGFLSQAGLLVNTLLPREVVDILTGAILLVFIATDRLAGRWARARRAAEVAA